MLAAETWRTQPRGRGEPGKGPLLVLSRCNSDDDCRLNRACAASSSCSSLLQPSRESSIRTAGAIPNCPSPSPLLLRLLLVLVSSRAQNGRGGEPITSPEARQIHVKAIFLIAKSTLRPFGSGVSGRWPVADRSVGFGYCRHVRSACNGRQQLSQIHSRCVRLPKYRASLSSRRSHYETLHRHFWG